MRYFCLLWLSLLALPAYAHAAEEPLPAVTQVPNGKSLLLANGDTVRLAAIEAPNTQEPNTKERKGRPGEPMGKEARANLEKWALGQRLHIAATTGARDRHGRLLGQVTRDDGASLQCEQLKAGMAMVYSFPDDGPELVHALQACEAPAREAKIGIWANPYWRVIAPAESEAFINRFKLVEGKVVSVNEHHGNIYINFSERWKGQFAVFIGAKHLDAFSGTDLQALAGKTIRVRGWIHYMHAPMIDLTHAGQIEVGR